MSFFPDRGSVGEFREIYEGVSQITALKKLVIIKRHLLYLDLNVSYFFACVVYILIF